MESLAKYLAQLFETVGKEGSFAVGVAFGTVVSFVAMWLSGAERRKRADLDFEREKELRGQLQLKDDRINELHKEIERVLRVHKSSEEKRGKP